MQGPPPLAGVLRAVRVARPPPPLAGVLARTPPSRDGARRLKAPPPPLAGWHPPLPKATEESS
eukprot:1059773-Alexandrium_andersonii.AAC.1